MKTEKENPDLPTGHHFPNSANRKQFIYFSFFFLNLVYCITCTKCHIQYVGQTKRRLMDRFQDHFYKIDKKVPNSDIGQHFNSPGHRGLADVEIHIVDFIHCAPESETARKLRYGIEKNWIFRLRTLIPQGLNLIDAPVYN